MITWLGWILQTQANTLPNFDALGIVERQLQGFSFFTWPWYQKITWISELESPNVSYHSAKFGGYRYCVSVDISFSCDHIIKSSRDFEDWVLPRQVASLPSLVAIDIAEVQI